MVLWYVLYEESLGSNIDLVFARHQTKMNHVRWDNHVECWRSEIQDSIKNFLFFGLPKGGFQRPSRHVSLT